MLAWAFAITADGIYGSLHGNGIRIARLHHPEGTTTLLLPALR